MSLRRFFRRAHWDRERAQEIESYVQIETDENVARGIAYDEARAAALRKFGNSTRVREEIYEMNTMALVDSVAREVRHGFRMLRHNPAFAAAALLTLAIGIGANTAVFSVVNSILLRPLPYQHQDQLISLRQLAPGAAGLADLSDGLLLSPSMYFTYADHNRAFRSMGVWATDTANVTGIGEPEQVRIAVVTSGVLETLAVSPQVGRWLSNGDQQPNAPKTAMLSYGYWQKRFAGDASAVGRVIRVDSDARQIVGVMPRGFRLVDSDFELILPAAFDRRTLTLAGFGYEGVARLKPGINIGQANGDAARLIPVWMDSWSNGPGTNPHFYEKWRITPAFVPLKRAVVGSVGDLLWIVMGTIALVMVIACANVTNLLLVRGEARQQELAVRAALGANWLRILRELLIENILLAVAGGALAVVLAYECLRLLVAMGPSNLPRLNEISLDGRALCFALFLSLASGLLCGSISALKNAGPRFSLSLRSAGRTSSQSRERHRTRNALVVGQVAIALLLLVSAGLMIRTFQRLRDVNPGFRDAAHLETMRISIPAQLVAAPERVTRMQQEILRKLTAVPGVANASFVSQMPMEDFGSDWDEIYADSKALTGKTLPLRLYKYVSPGFFYAAGTRLLAGRDLTWQDIYGNRPVVLISENVARELWGDPSAAVGKRVREFENMPWREVIGVVENTRENGVDKEAPAIVYWPPLMNYLFGRKELDAVRTVTFVIRSERAGSESLLHEIQQAVWSVDANLPVASARTMQGIYEHSLARTSFTMTMLGIAAAMALVLGVIGIYGVISYAVSQRRREIGIRLALGAQQRELKEMFVRSALTLASIGLGIGLIAAVAVMRLMRSVLFGISPLDPLTYIVVPLVLAVAAVLASYFPARRAAMVDPVEALKAE
jgi:putative ABC transport system permease protein